MAAASTSSPEGALPPASGPSEASSLAILEGTTETVALHHTPPVEGKGPAQPPPPLTPPSESSTAQQQQVSERLSHTQTQGGTPPLPRDTSPPSQPLPPAPPEPPPSPRLNRPSPLVLTSEVVLAPEPTQSMQSSTSPQVRPLTLQQVPPVAPIQTPSPTTARSPPPTLLQVSLPTPLPAPSLTLLTGSLPTPPLLPSLARTLTTETGGETMPVAAAAQSPLQALSSQPPGPRQPDGEEEEQCSVCHEAKVTHRYTLIVELVVSVYRVAVLSALGSTLN